MDPVLVVRFMTEVSQSILDGV